VSFEINDIKKKKAINVVFFVVNQCDQRFFMRSTCSNKFRAAYPLGESGETNEPHKNSRIFSIGIIDNSGQKKKKKNWRSGDGNPILCRNMVVDLGILIDNLWCRKSFG
jgi:hypothetical protein